MGRDLATVLGERFQPYQRLLTASDYRRVFEAPDHKAGQRELLMLARGNDLGRHRLGLAIAKKHVPLAVKRNLIKRLTRERFRVLPARQNCLDIIVLTRPGADKADNSELNKAIERQFERLGILGEPQ
ncbi:MAG: ribonuclease P protein component [Congregibacter sp.]